MKKKLTAIGNSYGLVIDKAILELLKITPDTELELSTDGTRLVIEPAGARRRSPPRPPAQLVPIPGPTPRPGRCEPRLGFPKKQPW
jgi:antitoxin component of MazEF toxin-antitoxin module